MRVFASTTCDEGSDHWDLYLNHFDGEKWTIDAIIEPFLMHIVTSVFADGFSMQVPAGFWSLVTKEADGSGDFRLVKG